MKPKISIIVPVYNMEKYLDKCLNSLVNQTLKDIEIILVNDGSTDNSVQIINKYLKKDKRILVLSQKNAGQASARNLGIKNSNGIFVMFVDSDDYVDFGICEKLYNKSVLDNSDIVVCDYNVVDENYNILGNNIKREFVADCNKNFIVNQSGPCFKIVKLDILKNNKLYFPTIRAYEDIAVVPAWGLFASKISYVNEKLYYYLVRNGSTMNQTRYNEKLAHIFIALENLKKYFNSDNKYNEEIEWIYIEHLLHASSLRFLKFSAFADLDRVVEIIRKDFSNWKKNKYYKSQSIKYKIICDLIYHKKYKLTKFLLKESS